MKEKDFSSFRESLANLTIEELETKANEIRDDISKMILDSDLIIKAAIVDSLLKERKENK